MTITRHALQAAGCVAAFSLIACSESPEAQIEPAQSSSQMASGSVFGGHTTAECIVDPTCRESVLSRVETRRGHLFYSPSEAFFDKSWQLPDFEKAE